jgi:phenylacetate-CoA ligase
VAGVMDLYWRLPVPVQEAALSLYSLRLDRWYYGRRFEELLTDFHTTRFDAAHHLGRLLDTAAEHVPAYRGRIPAGGDPFERLAAIEPLHRQRVREHEDEFLDSRLRKRRLFKDKTSGSTGTSLTIYWDRPSVQHLMAAFEARVRNPVMVGKDTPRSMLGGRAVVKGATKSPPFWRYNRRWQQLYLSSYHVSNANAPGYIEAIRKHRSVWLTGYGSAIAALAEAAMERGVDPLPLRGVVVSGDTLQPGMRASIEKFFQCRCYDSYGQVEGVAMAMECEHGRLHVVPEVGIVEILRDDGTAAAPGEVGELVGTTLCNMAMPLLRYRTGDEAAMAVDQSCACGAETPIIEALEGRTDDYLVTLDGRRIGRLSTAMKRSPSIHSAQLRQHRPGHARLLVRPTATYKPEDAEAVKADILERIGPFEIDIVEVDEIPTTPKGKTPLVVRE